MAENRQARRPAASLASIFFVSIVSLLLSTAANAAPVEFQFELPPDPQNPFARELWADVLTPSGKTRRLPVFFTGDNRFAVRTRPDHAGIYELDGILETTSDAPPRRLQPVSVASARVEVTKAATLPAVRLDPQNPRRFALADGRPYTPIGANLAWAESDDRMAFYRDALPAFGRAGLNWMRVWMVHWSALNLDWLPEDMGPSPPRGTLDLRVAAHWDELLAVAESSGVYVQLVLQHHGQYSSGVNTSWPDNPWNAARPGGFLAKPSEFFTSPEAKRLTKLKYRYIVARWGWSPAVMAWELFNEVHWTDPISVDRNEAAVSVWHAEMAAFLRSIDAHGHLITTSTENLRSPIYAAMDFYQPHLYATNILAGARFFDPAPGVLDRPVFYGEIGDDHLPLSAEEKSSGLAIVPPVWASLMGTGLYPAQPWLGAQLLRLNRLNELGAVARFVQSPQFPGPEATPFTPVVESATRIPLVLSGGQMWQRRPQRALSVPVDGREPLEFADLPRIFVGSPDSLADGFPARATLELDYAQAAQVRIRFADAGVGGARARVSLDGASVVEHIWPHVPTQPGTVVAPRPAELLLDIPAGRHVLALENAGGPDWFNLREIDLGVDAPALAAVGRRSAERIAAWIWHRQGVLAPNAPAPADGTLVIEDVPAGEWRVTWWDSLQGTPAAPVTLHHAGGPLRLTTPPISRHAAVLLAR